MSDAMLDTLKYSKTLIAGGMPQNQAEACASALASVIDNQLATKQDLTNSIKELKREFKSDINELRHEVKADILELKHELLLKLGAMIGFAVAVMGMLISFMHH